METAKASLQSLASARRACDICMRTTPDLIRNGSDFIFDPDVASHWAQWLGDSSPNLVIVGQDFGNLNYFKTFEGKDDPRNETNLQLYDLLHKAGLRPGRPPAFDGRSKIFLTNSVLCFKTAKEMNAPVKSLWTRNCTTLHLMPLLKILSPRIVVAMGGPAWKSLRRLFRLSSSPEGILQAAGGHWTSGQFEVFATVHCGRLGQANRAYPLQVEDWRKIGIFLESR